MSRVRCGPISREWISAHVFEWPIPQLGIVATGSISRFCEHRYRLLRLDQAAGLINLTTVLALARQRLAGTNPGAKILIVPAASTARPLRPVIDPPKRHPAPPFSTSYRFSQSGLGAPEKRKFVLAITSQAERLKYGEFIGELP